MNDVLVKEFIRKRGRGASLSVVDCRSVSRNVVEALEPTTRPRNGWRGWQAAPLAYYEKTRSKALGREECSDLPVLQSFWTWNRVPRADRTFVLPGRRGDTVINADELAALGRSLHADERGCVIM